MNPTRNFLLARAAAIVAQLSDRDGTPGINERIALRIEYRDLRHAMRHVPPNGEYALNVLGAAPTLWHQHCDNLGMSPHHTEANL